MIDENMLTDENVFKAFSSLHGASTVSSLLFSAPFYLFMLKFIKSILIRKLSGASFLTIFVVIPKA